LSRGWDARSPTRNPTFGPAHVDVRPVVVAGAPYSPGSATSQQASLRSQTVHSRGPTARPAPGGSDDRSSSPTPPASARRSHNTRNLLLAAIAVVVVGGVAIGGYGLYYLFLSPAGPAAVASSAPMIPPGAGVAAPASLDGTWNVTTSLGSMADFSASWAGYRVQEQLVGVGANTAVGRTPLVSGSMTLTGAVIDNVSITADLTALKSSDPNRDNQLRRQAIDTDQFRPPPSPQPGRSTSERCPPRARRCRWSRTAPSLFMALRRTSPSL